MRYPLSTWDNLKTKFDGQMAAVEAMGHRAYFIGWNKTGMWLCHGQQKTLLKRCRLTGLMGYAKTLLYVDLMDAVKAALRVERFDVVYIRFMPVFWNAPGALQALKRQGAKLILEHPTYPFENGKRTNPLRAPIFRYNERVLAKLEPLLDLYALIGDPCGETLHGVPAMNIVNGVDVERLPLHSPRPDTAQIGLLALASMSHWQGYDRLIDALARYPGGADVIIHMVGCEGDGSLAAWKRMAQERGLEGRVVFHGELYGEALDRVAAQCDVGVGGLGLYRKGQLCSMTLKLREYMARGLPFVYAVDDPSVPPNERFCLRLPNDDSPIDMACIVAFAERVKLDADAPREMRAYAAQHMSWQGVLHTVLERVGVPCPER